MVTDGFKNENSPNDKSTKEKILTSAVNLFAKKGFTETTIRELANAAGLKGGSIYNHFPSKNAILEFILEDYWTYSTGRFNEDIVRAKLKEDSTTEGIMDCLNLSFPEGKADYYLKVLCVLLQEQHRNPRIHDFVSNQIILRGEHDFRAIFGILKEMNVIREDTDIDPWVKIHSSLEYAFSSRMMMGIGDASPEFSGMGMIELTRFLIDLMLSTCKTNEE